MLICYKLYGKEGTFHDVFTVIVSCSITDLSVQSLKKLSNLHLLTKMTVIRKNSGNSVSKVSSHRKCLVLNLNHVWFCLSFDVRSLNNNLRAVFTRPLQCLALLGGLQ